MSKEQVQMTYRVVFEHDKMLVCMENGAKVARTLGPDALILVNAHDWERAQDAIRERADEIAAGVPE